jgi:epoxyqueuosine reductase
MIAAVTPGRKTREETVWIAERARALGFDLCGVVGLPTGGEISEAFPELDHLGDWLARDYAGEMKYLGDARRGDPRTVVEGAKSVIAVAMNYNSRHSQTASTVPASSAEEGPASPRGWISRYAWGDDYHEVLRARLNALVDALRAHFPVPFEARAYVDTGPVVERVAAKYGGLGWLGKNTCLIHPQLGSWLFLGVIVTSLDLEPSLAPAQPPPADLCGSCTRCLDACPTQAFPEPYVLDARRCISYLTIELRESIPAELRPAIGNAVIGCDICQDVCPWNRKAPATALAAFQPRENTANATSFLSPELERLASLSQEEFSTLFRNSAVKRAKWRGMVRNACVALGNSHIDREHPAYSRILQLLERLALSEDSLIAEHARWALETLGDQSRVP